MVANMLPDGGRLDKLKVIQSVSQPASQSVSRSVGRSQSANDSRTCGLARILGSIFRQSANLHINFLSIAPLLLNASSQVARTVLSSARLPAGPDPAHTQTPARSACAATAPRI